MHLSKREASICCLLALGKADKEIAAEIDRSTDTVRYYLRRLFARTGARSRARLAALFALTPTGAAQLRRVKW